MSILLFKFILFLPLGVFLVRRRLKYLLSLIILTALVCLTTTWAWQAFFSRDPLLFSFGLNFWVGRPVIVIDSLSAYFILLINFISLSSLIYAHGYLKAYQEKSDMLISIHYFSYLWLFVSMLLAVMLRDGFSFLLVWEGMSIASFLLVIFEAEKQDVLKAGVRYLVHMHVGFACLFVGFLITYIKIGCFDFDGLVIYFSRYPNLPLFILFFLGFGIKAGFFPFHTWLPHAHPVAPSHVSSLMSAAMIKIGIYGILRVLTYIQTDFFIIGIVIFIASILSGILGIMGASIQKDLKKILAYSSIENIGIVGLGVSGGLIGLGAGNQAMAALGFLGGLFHIFNHAFFKSLLFFTAGSVYQKVHTRNIDELGGLIKKMPFTSYAFLIGALAVCGLPPFNGFISEFFIYWGFLKGLSEANLWCSVIAMMGMAALALMGGLAFFCFTKTFGIAFLGHARSLKVNGAKEVEKMTIALEGCHIFLIIFIGLFSFLMLPALLRLIQIFSVDAAWTVILPFSETLKFVSIASGLLIGCFIFIFIFRSERLRKVKVSFGPTWACAAASVDSRRQYTSSSFSQNLVQLGSPNFQVQSHFDGIKEEEIFPQQKSFATVVCDSLERNVLKKTAKKIVIIFKKTSVLQTGQIQHYLFYALLFLGLIFILTILKII